MAAIRPGNQPVLLVVDVQVGVMTDAWEASRIVGNVARAVVRAREDGVPIVWVQHESDELPRDASVWQLVPELAPDTSEPRVCKRFNSSFEQTTLDAELAKVGATHIVLAGAATNWCIRATAYGALDRGYDVTLIADAHTTGSIDLGNGSRIEASDIVAELNVAMTWLEYPDRRNGATPVAQLDFTTVGGVR